MICDACNYYLFFTEDPFRSIGWGQQDFFGLLVRKTFAAGYSREDVSRLLLLATTGGLSRESLHIEQELVLLGELKTSDVKYIVWKMPLMSFVQRFCCCRSCLRSRKRG